MRSLSDRAFAVLFNSEYSYYGLQLQPDSEYSYYDLTKVLTNIQSP